MSGRVVQLLVSPPQIRIPPMHRMLLVVAVLATIVIGTSASQAQYSSQQIGAVRQGPIAKLIELERRKNEWLRQRFGR
jgi:hypothetical protein